MGLCQWFLCFAVFSCIGWAYESVYYSVQQRRPVNSGFLSTCFCPIYGAGALLNIIVLGRIENTFALFLAGMVLTGTLEYIVSWLLEKAFNKRWWDYTNWPANINGRVCLFGCMAFGCLTVLLMRFIAPVTIGIIENLSLFTVHALTAVVAFVILADTVLTVHNMDSSKLWYVEKQSEIFEGFNDNHGEFMEKIRNVLRK